MARVPQSIGDAADWSDEANDCMELRVCGLTYRQIAQTMTERGHKMSHQTARNRVEWAVNRIITPSVEELRRVEGERLDVAQRALLPKLATGDPAAVQAWTRLSESRRRLFGLDMPIKVDATVTERTQADIALEEMINEVKAANAARASVDA